MIYLQISTFSQKYPYFKDSFRLKYPLFVKISKFRSEVLRIEKQTPVLVYER